VTRGWKDKWLKLVSKSNDILSVCRSASASKCTADWIDLAARQGVVHPELNVQLNIAAAAGATRPCCCCCALPPPCTRSPCCPSCGCQVRCWMAFSSTLALAPC
jgi:hypothetical protein